MRSQSAAKKVNAAVEKQLSADSGVTAPYTLRSHRPIIHRQGVLYYGEYGWDEHFEALVAEICARFIQNEDPARERC